MIFIRGNPDPVNDSSGRRLCPACGGEAPCSYYRCFEFHRPQYALGIVTAAIAAALVELDRLAGDE